jgi:hypothetical protein
LEEILRVSFTGKEFKALMYSVGEELSRAQAAELFATYAHDDRISRPSYLEVRPNFERERGEIQWF